MAETMDPNMCCQWLADTNSSDYSYTIVVPRVTSSSNLAFIARADGSQRTLDDGH